MITAIPIERETTRPATEAQAAPSTPIPYPYIRIELRVILAVNDPIPHIIVYFPNPISLSWLPRLKVTAIINH